MRNSPFMIKWFIYLALIALSYVYASNTTLSIVPKTGKIFLDNHLAVISFTTEGPVKKGDVFYFSQTNVGSVSFDSDYCMNGKNQPVLYIDVSKKSSPHTLLVSVGDFSRVKCTMAVKTHPTGDYNDKISVSSSTHTSSEATWTLYEGTLSISPVPSLEPGYTNTYYYSINLDLSEKNLKNVMFNLHISNFGNSDGNLYNANSNFTPVEVFDCFDDDIMVATLVQTKEYIYEGSSTSVFIVKFVESSVIDRKSASCQFQVRQSGYYSSNLYVSSFADQPLLLFLDGADSYGEIRHLFPDQNLVFGSIIAKNLFSQVSIAVAPYIEEVCFRITGMKPSSSIIDHIASTLFPDSYSTKLKNSTYEVDSDSWELVPNGMKHLYSVYTSVDVTNPDAIKWKFCDSHISHSSFPNRIYFNNVPSESAQLSITSDMSNIDNSRAISFIFTNFNFFRMTSISVQTPYSLAHASALSSRCLINSHLDANPEYAPVLIDSIDFTEDGLLTLHTSSYSDEVIPTVTCRVSAYYSNSESVSQSSVSNENAKVSINNFPLPVSELDNVSVNFSYIEEDSLLQPLLRSPSVSANTQSVTEVDFFKPLNLDSVVSTDLLDGYNQLYEIKVDDFAVTFNPDQSYNIHLRVNGSTQKGVISQCSSDSGFVSAVTLVFSGIYAITIHDATLPSETTVTNVSLRCRLQFLSPTRESFTVVYLHKTETDEYKEGTLPSQTMTVPTIFTSNFFNTPGGGKGVMGFKRDIVNLLSSAPTEDVCGSTQASVTSLDQLHSFKIVYPSMGDWKLFLSDIQVTSSLGHNIHYFPSYLLIVFENTGVQFAEAETTVISVTSCVNTPELDFVVQSVRPGTSELEGRFEWIKGASTIVNFPEVFSMYTDQIYNLYPALGLPTVSLDNHWVKYGRIPVKEWDLNSPERIQYVLSPTASYNNVLPFPMKKTIPFDLADPDYGYTNTVDVTFYVPNDSSVVSQVTRSNITYNVLPPKKVSPTDKHIAFELDVYAFYFNTTLAINYNNLPIKYATCGSASEYVDHSAISFVSDADNVVTLKFLSDADYINYQTYPVRCNFTHLSEGSYEDKYYSGLITATVYSYSELGLKTSTASGQFDVLSASLVVEPPSVEIIPPGKEIISTPVTVKDTPSSGLTAEEIEDIIDKYSQSVKDVTGGSGNDVSVGNINTYPVDDKFDTDITINLGNGVDNDDFDLDIVDSINDDFTLKNKEDGKYNIVTSPPKVLQKPDTCVNRCGKGCLCKEKERCESNDDCISKFCSTTKESSEKICTYKSDEEPEPGNNGSLHFAPLVMMFALSLLSIYLTA